MITVMGATGNVGRRVTEVLLGAGEAVRALGRSKERLAPLADAGAETHEGPASDAAFLKRAFQGADAVFALLAASVRSPDYRAEQERQGEATLEAIRESGVEAVVFVSSVGAERPSGTGPIAGLHAQEARLRTLAGRNLLFLRPGSFFENFHGVLGLIARRGMNAGAVAPDLAIPMIATRDVADVAARALRARNWEGVVVRELLGPRDLSYAEATRILGERLGRPALPYVQLPYAEMVGALVQAGFSENVARLYVELDRAINEGRVGSRDGRTPENTTPTRFEDFVGELVRAGPPA